MKSCFYYLLLLCGYFLCLISFEAKAQTQYQAPTNLKASNIKSCSVTLSWDAQPMAISYDVRYQIKGSTQSPTVNVGVDTFYTFTGFNAATKYILKVDAKYSHKKKSDYSTLKITTTSYSVPENATASSISPTSAQITWQGCPSNNFQVRYKTTHATVWNYDACGCNMQVTLESLLPDSTYTYQVCGSTDTTGMWTAKNTFSMIPRPNILVLLMDDARMYTYSCHNGPSFFQSPSIDRIAHEGADFQNNYVVCSLCVPGRASLLTGLYPHHHGAIDLEDSIDAGIITLPEILSSAGYYTAMVGKYHMSMYPVPGWNYWLATTAAGSYTDKKYEYNGQPQKVIKGHSTHVLTDTAVAVINRAKGDFFLWVAYNAPHDPLEPTDEDALSYVNDSMPVAGNLDRYTQNYPSFLYDNSLSNAFKLQGDTVEQATRHYYQCVEGIDSSVKRIMETLEQKGILDNTIIILTSDNGRIIGEHGLNEKIFPYEESMRTPIWIRYPRWFADSTVIKNPVTLNVDVTPTILEAAGIKDTFHFDGVSLRKLATGEITRSNMMYEYLYSTSNYRGMPWMRGVRDSAYKYVKYGCNNVTEEFFDMQNDRLELVNLINKSDLQSLIQQYRDELTLLRNQYGDTITETSIDCQLSQAVMSRLSNEEPMPNNDLAVSPNPVRDNALLTGGFENADVMRAKLDVMNTVGQLIYSSIISCSAGRFEFNMDCRQFKTAGEYFVRVQAGSALLTQPFQVIK